MNKFILVGYVFVLLKYSTFTVNGQTRSCTRDNTVSIDGEVIQVPFYNCTYLSVKKTPTLEDAVNVPKNLLDDLQALDLSHNALNSLTSTTFAAYPNLKYLLMSNTFTLDLTMDTFPSLTNLIILDLCAFSSAVDTLINLPTKLKKFKGCQKKLNLNFMDSVALEYVDLSFSDLSGLPNFNSKAPLVFVNLNGNPLDNLEVEQLAPHCHIKELGVKLSINSKLLTPPKSCQCLRINLWISQFGLKAEPLNCSSLEEAPCEKEFSETLLSQRRICIGDKKRVMDSSESSSSKLLIVGILFLILLTLIVLGLAYRFVQSRKQSDDDDDSDDGEDDTDEETD